MPVRARRGAIASAVLVAAAALGPAHLVPGTAAALAAGATNPSSAFAFKSLYAPGALAAAPTGHDVGLTWSAGRNGSAYAVRGVANGASGNCGGVSYGTIGSAAGTSYTDGGRFLPQGTWFCYEVRTSDGLWTSVQGNPTAATIVGFVATSVQVVNGGTAGTLDQGDRIVVTFNQAVDTASGPGGTDVVCASKANAPNAAIMLASTVQTGNCTDTESVSLGKLAGGGAQKSGRFAATWVWSAGNTVLTVTVGTRKAGADSTLSGGWTFDPVTTAAKMLSSAGAFHVCDSDSGGGICLPAATGSF